MALKRHYFHHCTRLEISLLSRFVKVVLHSLIINKKIKNPFSKKTFDHKHRVLNSAKIQQQLQNREKALRTLRRRVSRKRLACYPFGDQFWSALAPVQVATESVFSRA